MVFVRHGLSEWNMLNQFTGWIDVDLNEDGVKEVLKMRGVDTQMFD